MKGAPPRCGLLFFEFLLLIVAPLSAQPPARIERPKNDHGYVSVTYPPDFDLSKTYSVLYWFHGTSGKPSPGIGAATKDYVTVGMGYLKAPHVPPGEYGKSHWAECVAIRAELEAAGVKLDRDVVGGVSKGGWVCFQIGIEVPEGPDGVAIIAAGKPSTVKEVKPLPKSLSVLIGVGETDPNYPHSQTAVAYLREAGATLCYEEWLGKGHVSEASERVLDWLRVESLRGNPGVLSRHATARIQKELVMIDGISDPTERYAALRSLMGHPALPYADPSLVSQAREKGALASRDPKITDWLKQYNSMRELVARETAFFDGTDFDSAKLETLAGHYKKFAEATSDPSLAARASYAAVRILKLAEMEALKGKALDNPEYIALDARFKEKLAAFRKAIGDNRQRLYTELTPLITEINTKRNEAAMEAFYQVEWRKLKVDDPLISSKIAADPKDQIRVSLGAGF